MKIYFFKTLICIFFHNWRKYFSTKIYISSDILQKRFIFYTENILDYATLYLPIMFWFNENRNCIWSAILNQLTYISNFYYLYCLPPPCNSFSAPRSFLRDLNSENVKRINCEEIFSLAAHTHHTTYIYLGVSTLV